jgi:hypothetical protein
MDDCHLSYITKLEKTHTHRAWILDYSVCELSSNSLLVMANLCN